MSLELNNLICEYTSNYVIQLIFKDFSAKIKRDLLTIADKTENEELRLAVINYFG